MNYAAVLLLLFTTVLTNAQGPNVAAKPVPIALYKVEPEYTPTARQARIEGDVLLRANISTTGKAENIRVIKPLAHGLDGKAIECLRKWRFQPALKQGGIPYVVRHDVAIPFRLQDSK